MFMLVSAVMFEFCLSISPMQSADDPLPPAALVRFGTAGFWHSDPIAWVDFTPDGKTVLTAGGYDDQFRFWNAATRKELARYPGGWSTRDTFALSADRARLVLFDYGDRDEVKVLDVLSRKEIRRFMGEELFGPKLDRPHQRFILSPDGRFLALGNMYAAHLGKRDEKARGFLCLWDIDSGRRIHEWKTGDVYEAEFAPDGETLIVHEWDEAAKKSSLRSWKVSSGKDLHSVELPRRLSRFVCLPDGKTILGLTQERDVFHRYDIATGKELATISKKGGRVFAFALSPDGQNLATVQAGRLVVQGLGDGKKVLELQFPRLPFTDTGNHYTNAQTVAFSPDGKTVAIAKGRTLELWDVATGMRLHGDDNMGGSVLAVHTHGRHILARSKDMTLTLWDLRTGKLQRRFTDEPSQLPLNERQQMPVREFFDRFHWRGSSQAISPDGQKAAALWRDGPIHLFDLASGKTLHRFTGSDEATCLTFSADGKLLAGPTPDGRICLWDTTTGMRIQHLAAPLAFDRVNDFRSVFLALRFSPDGKALAASTWLTQEACDFLSLELATGNLRFSIDKEKRTAHGHSDRLLETSTLSFVDAPGGKHLAAATPRFIRLLDRASGKEVRRFGGRDIAGQSAAFSPDGKLVAAGLDNGGIRFWDTATGAVVRDAPAHGAMVTSLSFADAGKTLVSGSLDGTAIAWDLNLLLKDPPADTTELDKLWTSLGQNDSEKASQAMQSLTARPKETLALFKARLRPVPAVAPDRLTQLLADLQSNQYAVRQRATEELEQLDLQARPALEKALDAQPAVEARRRIEALLKKLEPPFSAPDRLRSIRAVEVVERIGSMDARLFLEALASGGPGGRLTEDACAALERLSKRPPELVDGIPMRIAIGQLWQESNTLNPIPTTLADFEAFGIFEGAEILERFAETNELGGFIQSLRAWPGPPEIVPLMRFAAWPSGPLDSGTFKVLIDRMMEALRRAGQVDAVLLALHGSLVAECEPDVEGHLLRRIREHIGPQIPLVATLDLHANVTQRMVEAADVLTLYHTAPHIDVMGTGKRGAEALRRILLDGAKPVTAFRKMPLVVPAERANTQDPASFSYGVRKTLEGWERNHHVLSAGVATVQPWLDIPNLGSSTLVVVDGDAWKPWAEEACANLANEVWTHRRDYLTDLVDAADAVRAAFGQADGLTVISDSADATTSGSTGDSTTLLSELIKYDWPRPAAVTLVGPETVVEATRRGSGAEWTATLGATRNPRDFAPITLPVRVAKLFDANLILSGHLAEKLPIDMGRSAVLTHGNIHVVVTSRTGPHFAPQLFQTAGLDPFAASVVIAKSPCGFRAAYGGHAKQILVARAPGCAPSDFWKLPFTRIPRPLWPWDEMEWSAR